MWVPCATLALLANTRTKKRGPEGPNRRTKPGPWLMLPSSLCGTERALSAPGDRSQEPPGRKPLSQCISRCRCSSLYRPAILLNCDFDLRKFLRKTHLDGKQAFSLHFGCAILPCPRGFALLLGGEGWGFAGEGYCHWFRCPFFV